MSANIHKHFDLKKCYFNILEKCVFSHQTSRAIVLISIIRPDIYVVVYNDRIQTEFFFSKTYIINIKEPLYFIHFLVCLYKILNYIFSRTNIIHFQKEIEKNYMKLNKYKQYQMKIHSKRAHSGAQDEKKTVIIHSCMIYK